MNLGLLFDISVVIQIHFFFAISAFVIGALQLLWKKGTNFHKVMGRLWVAMMLIICVTSFWIKELMPNGIFLGYSPIHLLSIFVIFQITLGVYFARIGNILGHKKCMTYTYIGGLIIAGAFTFYTGRFLYKVFIENSSFSRQHLKERIIKNKLIDYKCEECENDGEWNGKKLSLHLEHKNGVNDDNRLDNLTFLCPNCHSQTDTYSGKKRKRKEKRRCKCGKEIFKTSKMCSECNSIKSRKVERP